MDGIIGIGDYYLNNAKINWGCKEKIFLFNVCKLLIKYHNCVRTRKENLPTSFCSREFFEWFLWIYDLNKKQTLEWHSDSETNNIHVSSTCICHPIDFNQKTFPSLNWLSLYWCLEGCNVVTEQSKNIVGNLVCCACEGRWTRFQWYARGYSFHCWHVTARQWVKQSGLMDELYLPQCKGKSIFFSWHGCTRDLSKHRSQ